MILPGHNPAQPEKPLENDQNGVETREKLSPFSRSLSSSKCPYSTKTNISGTNANRPVRMVTTFSLAPASTMGLPLGEAPCAPADATADAAAEAEAEAAAEAEAEAEAAGSQVVPAAQVVPEAQVTFWAQVRPAEWVTPGVARQPVAVTGAVAGVVAGV